MSELIQTAGSSIFVDGHKARIDGQKICATHHFLPEAQGGHLVPRSNRLVFECRAEEPDSELVFEEGVFCVMCHNVGLGSTIDALLYGSGCYTEPMPIYSQVRHAYVFSYDLLVSACCSFDNFQQFEIFPQPIGRRFSRDEFADMPRKLQRVAEALQKVGFRVVAPADLVEFRNHMQRNVVMVRGERLFPDDDSRPATDGVTVTLSYIVGDTPDPQI